MKIFGLLYTCRTWHCKYCTKFHLTRIFVETEALSPTFFWAVSIFAGCGLLRFFRERVWRGGTLYSLISDTCPYWSVWYRKDFNLTHFHIHTWSNVLIDISLVHTDTLCLVQMSSYTSAYSNLRYRKFLSQTHFHMGPWENVQILTAHWYILTDSVL